MKHPRKKIRGEEMKHPRKKIRGEEMKHPRKKRYVQTIGVPLTLETIYAAEQLMTNSLTRTDILRTAINLGLDVMKKGKVK